MDPGTLNVLGTNTSVTGAMCLGGADLTFTKPGHPPGIYCLTGTTATLTSGGGNGTDFSGYTFFAPSISASSNSQKFSPATGQTTVFDAFVGNLTLNGNSDTVSGLPPAGAYMFAPNGAANISGAALGTGSGFIESQTINISGNFASFTGTGPPSGSTPPVTIITIRSTTTTPVTTIPGTTVASSTQTGTTNPGSTAPGTTNAGSTSPGSTGPGITQTGTTVPDSTQTSTTGTTFGLGE